MNFSVNEHDNRAHKCHW